MYAVWEIHNSGEEGWTWGTEYDLGVPIIPTFFEKEDAEEFAEERNTKYWVYKTEIKEVTVSKTNLLAENKRLKQWIDDLQAGTFITCVYCGHNYGPDDEIPTSMANVLKEHVENCPEHPMSALKKELEKANVK